MKSRILLVFVLVCTVILSLAATAIVAAQDGGDRPYPEGEDPQAVVQVINGDDSKPNEEGNDPNVVIETGTIDEAQLEQLNTSDVSPLGGGGMPMVYQFTGVRDDGTNGTNSKVATSLICTNTSSAAATLLYVVYTYNSASYYSVTVPSTTFLSGRTYTISTQPTAILFDDAALSTSIIDQGIGKVYSDAASIICTAQMLDPAGNPPAFVTELEMYH